MARSRVTAQGQVSVPASVRRKLGIGRGSVLEWQEEDDKVVIRRVGRFSSEDIHSMLFGKRAPRKRTVEDMKEGVRRYVRRRCARG
jgi:antitoxin PrlF